MTPLLFISTLITAFSAMALLGSIMASKTTRASAARVLEVTTGSSRRSVREGFSLRSLQAPLLNGVRRVRTLLGMGEDAKGLDMLARAGFRSSVARDTYFAIRLLAPLGAALVGSFVSSSRMFAMLTMGGIFYLAPSIVLGRLVKRHREKIRLGIPDAIDLLVICVDAGLGMDQAMLRVGDELASSHIEIHQEILQINREQRAGKLRLDAWRAMAERSSLAEIDGFVEMLLQTERFGTPIARALSNYGDGIRQKRRQRAEEMAAKTTVKIIFPLVLFIFPSMFIVLLGPAGITIARGLATGTQ
jgi:tight adherence protein C